MATPNWFSRSSPFFVMSADPFKIVGGIELIVSEKFPTGAMETIGAGLDGGVENRGAGTSKLRAEVRGLNLEFLNRVDRRKDDEIRAVKEVHGVGIVVNAIEQVVVLRWAQPLAEKAPLAALPRVSDCGEFTPAPSCARKVKFRPFKGSSLTLAVDHLADGSVLGFEYGSAARYLDRLRHLARLQSEIDHHGGADVDRDVSLLGGLESLGGSAKLVASDPDRREFVSAVRSYCGGESGTRCLRWSA